MTTTVWPTTVTPIVQGEAIRTVAPAAMAVDIDDALEHARLDSNPNDFRSVLAMLAAATEAVENYTGLGLVAQTWQQSFSAWPTVLTLQRRPLLAIGSPAQAVSIAYLDSDGVSEALPSTEYAVTGIGGEKVNGTVRLAGTAWPGAFAHPEAITVTYTVGYGTSAASVPALIKHAVLMTFTTFYEFREDFVEGRGTINEIPTASKSLAATLASSSGGVMNRADAAAANAAAALEPLLERFAGQTALVFASGPSLTQLWSAERAIPLPSIAVSDAWRIAPDADVVVASDSLWWMHHKGLPDYRGVKVGSRSDGGGLPAGVVALQQSGEEGYDHRLGWFRHGHNSGYAAAHLAAQLGAVRVVLVGFDMRQVDGKDRWFGAHPEPLRRPATTPSPYNVWITRFAGLGKALAARGVELVNATPGSALKGFPFMDLEDVFPHETFVEGYTGRHRLAAGGLDGAAPATTGSYDDGQPERSGPGAAEETARPGDRSA